MGETAAVDENLNVLNSQGGTTFDLGAGLNDELHLNTEPVSPGGPNAVNVVTVFNTEHVFGALADDDQIHIGGNSEGMTTVTGGIGSDQIWASADVDHFRFESAGHSAFDLYDTPAGGSHDLITDFDDSEDQLVFDGVEFETATFSWQQLDFGDVDYVIVDTDGNSGVDSNEITSAMKWSSSCRTSTGRSPPATSW